MSGSDDYDSTCSEKPVPQYSQKLNINNPYTIGYIKEALEESPALNEEVKGPLLQKIEQLKALGNKVIPVDFPYLNYIVPAYYILTTAEASSNLARYDGVHYGHRSVDAQDIPSTYASSRTEGFGNEVQRRIMLGTFVLSSGYYDAYYTKAQKVRRMLLDKTQAILKNVISFVADVTTHRIRNWQKHDPTQLYLEDIFTVTLILAGAPTVSLPTGIHSNGLPFGIQLMAPAFKEDQLFDISNQIMNTH